MGWSECNTVQCTLLPFQYLLEIDDHLDVKNIYVVQPHNLPESYIPGKNSYYKDLQLNPESIPFGEK